LISIDTAENFKVGVKLQSITHSLTYVLSNLMILRQTEN